MILSILSIWFHCTQMILTRLYLKIYIIHFHDGTLSQLSFLSPTTFLSFPEITVFPWRGSEWPNFLGSLHFMPRDNLQDIPNLYVKECKLISSKCNTWNCSRFLRAIFPILYSKGLPQYSPVTWNQNSTKPKLSTALNPHPLLLVSILDKT